MPTNSLRRQLPLTYAGIALLTAAALTSILLVTLHLYYSRQEQAFLHLTALRLSQVLAPEMAAGMAPEQLQALVDAYAQDAQVRVRVLGNDGRVVADSGIPPPRLDPRLSLPLTAPVPPVDVAQADATAEAATREPATTMPAATAASAAEGTVPAAAEVLVPEVELRPAGRSGARTEFPIVDPGTQRLLGRLELSQGPAYGREIVGRVALVGAWASLAAVLLGAAAGWLVSRHLTMPLVALTSTATRMAEGDLAARAQVTREDEIGRLGKAFDEMAGRLELTVVALRRFVADAAHQLHTPLTALRTNLDLVADVSDSELAREYMARAQAQAERLAGLTNSLLDLSRLEARVPAVHDPVDLAALVGRLAERYASQAEQAGVAFEVALPDSAVIVTGDARQIEQAAGNVLDNALKFTPTEGRVFVRLSHEAGWVCLSVEDSGIGILPEDRPRLFQRFHRGRNAAAYPGSGLGLAIVQAIVEQHGGWVQVEALARGTRVTLAWPEQPE